MLLATVDAVSTAQQASQAMADKNIYTYVIVTLVSGIVGLFTAFLLQVRKANTVQELRIKDRDAFQEKLDALSRDFQEKVDALSRDTGQIVQENTQGMFVLTRAVDELREKKGLKPHTPAQPKLKEGT